MKKTALLALLAVLFLVSPHAIAGTPGFMIQFDFQPPLAVKGYSMPAVSMEACSDQTCKTVTGTVKLTCTSGNMRAGNGISVGRCSAVASWGQSGADNNLTLLSHGGFMRLHAGDEFSTAFYFLGREPTSPYGIFNFAVSPGPGGLVVVRE